MLIWEGTRQAWSAFEAGTYATLFICIFGFLVREYRMKSNVGRVGLWALSRMHTKVFLPLQPAHDAHSRRNQTSLTLAMIGGPGGVSLITHECDSDQGASAPYEQTDTTFDNRVHDFPQSVCQLRENLAVILDNRLHHAMMLLFTRKILFSRVREPR